MSSRKTADKSMVEDALDDEQKEHLLNSMFSCVNTNYVFNFCNFSQGMFYLFRNTIAMLG